MVTASRDARIDAPDAAVEQLRVAVDSLGATSTISLQGEWDIAGEPEISQAIARALASSPACLVLDLSRLSFMDACGVHVTARLRQLSDTENFRLVFVPGPRQVRRILEICQWIKVPDSPREHADCR